MSVVGDLVGPLRPSYDGPVDNENIYRRNGGCGVVAEDKFYVWGGEGAEQRLLDPDRGGGFFRGPGGRYLVCHCPPSSARHRLPFRRL